jgi:hypothetical protein
VHFSCAFTKRAATVPQGALFTNAVKNLSDGLASASVNTNVFRHFVKTGDKQLFSKAQYDYITQLMKIGGVECTKMF